MEEKVRVEIVEKSVCREGGGEGEEEEKHW